MERQPTATPVLRASRCAGALSGAEEPGGGAGGGARQRGGGAATLRRRGAAGRRRHRALEPDGHFGAPAAHRQLQGLRHPSLDDWPAYCFNHHTTFII